MERNGGEQVTLVNVLATPKAQAQLRELRPGLDLTDLVAPLLGGTVRRMADASPYWLAESEGLRLVFCVMRNRSGRDLPPHAGRFALVTVQELWAGESSGRGRP